MIIILISGIKPYEAGRRCHAHDNRLVFVIDRRDSI